MARPPAITACWSTGRAPSGRRALSRWEDKMSDQIDRYTTKFSKLEQLIAEMNSQSSALMGLMGGSSGY